MPEPTKQTTEADPSRLETTIAPPKAPAKPKSPRPKARTQVQLQADERWRTLGSESRWLLLYLLTKEGDGSGFTTPNPAAYAELARADLVATRPESDGHSVWLGEKGRALGNHAMAERLPGTKEWRGA